MLRLVLTLPIGHPATRRVTGGVCQNGWDTWKVGDTMDNLSTRQQMRLMDGRYKERFWLRGSVDLHTRLLRRYVFVCEYVLAARDMGDTVGERRARARAHYLVRAMRRYPSVSQMATAREVCGLAL